MTYVNHEAVPSHEAICDYFTEVELFRVNHLVLPLSREVGECTRFWRRRRGHGQYMLAYDNGKSAVRVLPGKIVPESVHRWRTLRPDEYAAHGHGSDSSEAGQGAHLPAQGMTVPSPSETSPTVGYAEGCHGVKSSELGIPQVKVEELHSRNDDDSSKGSVTGSSKDVGKHKTKLVSRCAMADPRELRFQEVLECSDPCVLHYPCCGLDWLRDKYRLLGSFPSAWFGGRLPIAPCFHLDARNTVQRQKTADFEGVADLSGADPARDLYRKEVMLCPHRDSESMHMQIECGVLRVISGAAQVIKRARQDKDGAHSPQARLSLHAQQLSSQEGADEGLVRDSAVVQYDGDDGGHDPARYPESGGTRGVARKHDQSRDENMAPGPAGKSEADATASRGFENAWILAAVARKYL